MIKFKTWCKNKKEFEKGIVLNENGNPYDVYSNSCSIRPIRKDTHIVSISLGLCDKNGEEIYVGDIVKINDEVAEVILEDGCLKASYKDLPYYDYLHMVCDMAEIVGNVYENPELLNTKGSLI